MTGGELKLCKHRPELLRKFDHVEWCSGCGSIRAHHTDHIGPWQESRAIVFLRAFLDLDGESSHGQRRG